MMKFSAPRGNVQIAYDVLGTGAPVMMLHDFGQSSGVWYDCGYVKACLARGRQVVLVDLRGHGDSSEPIDATAYGPIQCSWDIVAVLDHAGIARADILGYGVGGRVALCIAAVAPGRVHAIAAGGAHPFAERVSLKGDAPPCGIEPWVKLIQAKVAAGCDPRLVAEAVVSDWPDIADAVARSRVPILLFVGRDDPRYPLVLSFAERSGAHVITLAGDGHAAPLVPAGRELSPQILDFFETPEARGLKGALPPCLWSGSWA